MYELTSQIGGSAVSLNFPAEQPIGGERPPGLITSPRLHPRPQIQQVAHLWRHRRVRGKWKMSLHNAGAGPEDVSYRPTVCSRGRPRQLRWASHMRVQY